MDASAKADQLNLEKERIASQERIAGLQVGAKTAKDKNDLELEKMMEGFKIGQSLNEANQLKKGNKE
jgi:hypothetical protein